MHIAVELFVQYLESKGICCSVDNAEPDPFQIIIWDDRPGNVQRDHFNIFYSDAFDVSPENLIPAFFTWQPFKEQQWVWWPIDITNPAYNPEEVFCEIYKYLNAIKGEQ